MPKIEQRKIRTQVRCCSENAAYEGLIIYSGIIIINKIIVKILTHNKFPNYPAVVACRQSARFIRGVILYSVNFDCVFWSLWYFLFLLFSFGQIQSLSVKFNQLTFVVIIFRSCSNSQGLQVSVIFNPLFGNRYYSMIFIQYYYLVSTFTGHIPTLEKWPILLIPKY